MYVFYFFLILIALSLIGLIIGSYFVFLRTCKRKPDRPNVFEAMFSERRLLLSTEERLRNDYNWYDSAKRSELSIKSKDGLWLYAELIMPQNENTPKGTIIFLHGYHSTPRRDFCMHLKLLNLLGYALITVNQRSHGKSEGKYVCFGINERYDAFLWSQKATELFGKDMPICVMGLSMGGATALMTSDLAKNNPSVKCIVADCPFASPWEIIAHVLKKKHKIYPFPIMYFVNFWCIVLAKFNLRKSSAVKSIKNSDIPTLIFHGECDKFVPSEHSKAIALASNNVKLLLFEDARHAESIHCEEQRYISELLSFLDNNM